MDEAWRTECECYEPGEGTCEGQSDGPWVYCQPCLLRCYRKAEEKLKFSNNVAVEISKNQSETLFRVSDLEADIRSAKDMLAVIHRDGGHHTGNVGFRRSCQDAQVAIHRARAKLAAVESLIDVDAHFDEQFDDKIKSWRDGYMCAIDRVDAELDTGRQKSTVLAGWKRR